MGLKIAFFGIAGSSRYTYADAINHCDAMPRSSGTTLANVLELYEKTGNKGNMIHGEAPTRIFQFDRQRSCYISAESLIVNSGWGAEEVAKELSKKFDLVVFSTANMIRENFDPGATAEILESLTCDFMVLGMGMQDSLPQSRELLHPNLDSLLDVCNRKAVIFGVRGKRTKDWLGAVGFDNAKALGCPSLYVYPHNILGMDVPDGRQIGSALTGGYISARIPRSSAIVKLFKGENAHYVMQDEVDVLKDLEELSKSQNLYNDATGEIDKDVMDSVFEKIHYKLSPFKSYRWFQDPNAWRVFASGFDVYVGDRLHGGIVALQAGVPSIMVAEDQRVSEVAEYVGLPVVSMENIEGMKLRDVVTEYLSADSINSFKDLYYKRLQEFEDTFKDLDLAFSVNSRGLRESCGIRKKSRSQVRARLGILQHVLRKIMR